MQQFALDEKIYVTTFYALRELRGLFEIHDN